MFTCRTIHILCCRQMVRWCQRTRLTLPFTSSSLSTVHRWRGKFDPGEWIFRFHKALNSLFYFPFNCLTLFRVLLSFVMPNRWTCNGHFQPNPLFGWFSPPPPTTTDISSTNFAFSTYKFSCHMDFMLSRCLDALYLTQNFDFHKTL